MTLATFTAVRRAAAPLLLGARRPSLSIDISCLHGVQQQTRRTPLLLSNDGTQTDGWTPDRFIDSASHTMRSVLLSRSNVFIGVIYICTVLQITTICACTRLTSFRPVPRVTCYTPAGPAVYREALSTTAIRPFVRLSVPAIGYRHAGCLQLAGHQRCAECGPVRGRT